MAIEKQSGWCCQWRVQKYHEDGTLYDDVALDGNVLTVSGMAVILDALTVGSAVVYNNANSFLGVGSGTGGDITNRTDLTGTKVRTAMDATYPLSTLDANGHIISMTYQSTFGSSQGNYAWTEFGLFNSITNGAGTMLNRKYVAASLGTKVSGSTWVLSVTFIFTSPVQGVVVSIADYKAFWKFVDANDTFGSLHWTNTSVTFTSSGGKGDGQYASFNGTSSKLVQVLSSFDLNADWSVSFWSRSVINFSSRAILSFGLGGSDHGFYFRTGSSASANLVASGAGGIVTTGIAATYTNWNHFVIARRGAYLYVYVNATLTNTINITACGVMTPPTNYQLGARNSSNYFQGDISCFAQYTRALMQAAVTRLYAAGAGLGYTTKTSESPAVTDRLNGAAAVVLDAYTSTDGITYGGSNTNFLFTSRLKLRPTGLSGGNFYNATLRLPTVSTAKQTQPDWWIQGDLTFITNQTSVALACGSGMPIGTLQMGVALRSLDSEAFQIAFMYRGDTQQWCTYVNGAISTSSSTGVFSTLNSLGGVYQATLNIRLECDREIIRCYVDGVLVITENNWKNISCGYAGIAAFAVASGFTAPTDTETLELSNLKTGSLY